jgi:hypothetical protein
MVMHTYDFSTQEAEAGRKQVWGQSGLHSKTLSQKKKDIVNKVTHPSHPWESLINLSGLGAEIIL